jgi:5'-deoxynucleotidase YfbR-like HD superfamily hydrolase
MKIAELLRMSHTKRWGIVNTTRVQNVAEHAFNVTLIVMAIIRRWRPDDEIYQMSTFDLLAALLHDAEEIRTGDTPTPQKMRLREAGAADAMRGVRADIMNDLLGEKLHIAVDDTKHDSEFQFILKAADLIESIWFIQIEGVGAHAKQVRLFLVDLWIKHMMNRPNPEIQAAATDIYNTVISEGLQ